jgi:hypothetical protein
MARAEARTAFKEIVASVSERRAALEQLVTLNGFSNDTGGWTRMFDKHAESVNHELTELWRSVVFDVSVTMSDMLIERSAGAITWKFYAGSKKSLDYHQPVLIGFTNVPARYYHYSFHHPMTNMVGKAAGGSEMSGLSDYFEYIAGDL